MCPLCLTTLGLIATGVASTGGLAAWVVKGPPARRSAEAADGEDPLCGQDGPKQITDKSEAKEKPRWEP
jgi:hypothetical protein